jgi:hypothetical protein
VPPGVGVEQALARQPQLFLQDRIQGSILALMLLCFYTATILGQVS